MGQYAISEEKLPEVYSELEPLFRAHYQQMSDRLWPDGQASPTVHAPAFQPRLDEYFRAADSGWLKTFVLRCDGKACGYALVYVTNDMHNGELIAQEDVLFVSPEHRNGVGKKLVQFGLEFLRALGVKRLSVSAVTDLRVAKLWSRMGFKETAVQMTYTF